MSKKTTLDTVQQYVLQPDAVYWDWLAASAASRYVYVKTALERCEEAKLGTADAHAVISRMDEILRKNDTDKVSMAFGMAFNWLHTPIQ